MVDSAEEDRQKQAGFERVHVELDWYDGPRGGLADVEGVAHYFQAVHSYSRGEPDDEYFVWPASETTLAMEREAWTIFVDWNARYETGAATTDTHPAIEGANARYDELTALLAPCRAEPNDARRLVAEWRPSGRAVRYHTDGPDYVVRWRSNG